MIAGKRENMKIGILTHYNVNNLGAQLQMYATYTVLKELGHRPVVLTYNKNFDFEHEQKLRNEISLKSIPYICREFLIKKGIRQTWHNTCKYWINKRFRQENLDFSFYASTPVDAAIVGADEVFSLQVGINMMMYGHGVLTDHCIAYAPAFGETDMKRIREYHAEELISSGLGRFTALSARDTHTADLVEQLTGKKPISVCDPVILYDFNDTHAPIKRISGKYIAIYSYDRNMIDKEEIRQIKAYAKANSYRTVSIGNYHKWCDLNITCDCLEWLEYMRNAECVITDTFHGAVVATILHKEMAVMIRSINRNKIKALLRDTGTEKRLISQLTEAELKRVFSVPTDFEKVERMLNDLRGKSMRYLTDALAQC